MTVVISAEDGPRHRRLNWIRWGQNSIDEIRLDSHPTDSMLVETLHFLKDVITEIEIDSLLTVYKRPADG
jgi:hypothetical protein